MNFENALVSRKMHVVESGEVCINEVWDLKHPESPFFSWCPFPSDTPPLMWRYFLMNQEQYDQIKPPLKD